MKSMEKFFYRNLHKIRRSVQFGSLVLLFLIPVLNLYAIHFIKGTFYSMSIGNLDLVDPSMVIQHLLLTKEIYTPMLFGAVIIGIIAFFSGRLFCGWICPYNFFMEITTGLKRKFTKAKVEKKKNRNPVSFVFWFIFSMILFITALSGVPLITLISFPGIISGGISDLIYWGTLGSGFILLLGIFVFDLIFFPRFWCRTVCPVGATLALFKGKKSLTAVFQPSQCNCTASYLPCNVSCPIHLDPRKKDFYPACMNCGECI